MLTDVRNAIRALRAAPGFTLVALAVLTLGIGAGTAIFSVVDAVVLRGLPFDEADRLAAVTTTDPALQAGRVSFAGVTPQDYADWKARQDVFEGLGASASLGGFTLKDGGRPEDLRVVRITANLFPLLRVRPRVGRLFTESQELDGNHRVALLSDSLWRRRFGADPDVVGKTMTFESGVWEVVGVMPPGFAYPVGEARPAEMWVPYVVPANQRVRGTSRNFYLSVVGRLRPAATIDGARAQMDQVNSTIAQAFPKWIGTRRTVVSPLHDAIVGDRVRSWMLMLLGAVAFVLLIACVNVANLMLARATARSREMSVRVALGATRWRLARALLVESLVLSIAGTIGGLVVAWWGVAILRASLPESLPRLSSIAVDWRVLAAAALAAIGTGVSFGLAPAWQSSHPDPAGALREGGRSSTAGAGRQRLRTVFVVAEVALAVVLLVGSGLFVSSFVRLMRVNVGLDYHNVLTVPVYPRIDFAAMRADRARAAQLIPAVLERVRAVPGVDVAAAIANGLPLSGSWSRTDVKVPGRAEAFSRLDSVDTRAISPNYFAAVRVPLLKGRLFTDADNTATAEAVVILNDVAAARYLPDRDPIGVQIDINGLRTVVGVVGSIRLGGPESEVRPESYAPMAQDQIVGADLTLRTTGDPLRVAAAVQAAIWSVAPDLAMREAQSLEQLFGGLTAQRRFNMQVLSLFGVLAIVIAAVGIYGVMAYTVEQRTQEIGVRVALGALPGGIVRMVLGRAAVFMATGLAAGLAAAWGLARLVAAFLFQVPAHDPLVYGGVALTLAAVGLLAALVPALRAARVDPLVALRN